MTSYDYNMNARLCPECGSEMMRDGMDDPHDERVQHFICCNSECRCETTVTAVDMQWQAKETP